MPLFLPVSAEFGLAPLLVEKYRADRLPCAPVWPPPWKEHVIVCVFESPAGGESAAVVRSAAELRDAKYHRSPKSWVRLPKTQIAQLAPWIPIEGVD